MFSPLLIRLTRGITVFTVAVASLFFTPLPAHAETTMETGPGQYPYRNALLITGTAASIWVMSSSDVASDKKRHFGLSVVLGAGSEYILRKYAFTAHHRWRRVILATGLATIPGIIKESTDFRFDTDDLLADVVGSFTGAFLTDLIQGPNNQVFAVIPAKDGITLKWAMRL